LEKGTFWREIRTEGVFWGKVGGSEKGSPQNEGLLEGRVDLKERGNQKNQRKLHGSQNEKLFGGEIERWGKKKGRF